MKKVGLIISIFICVFILSTLVCGLGLIAHAEDEISLDNMTAVNYKGETIAYNGSSYARDITLNYSFQSAHYYLINVYVKEGASYNLYLTTFKETVVDGKGSYLVNVDGDLMIECVAKNYSEFTIATLSTFILSDVTAPTAPALDADGVMDVAHSAPFSVSYSIAYDNLSGVDFARSFYRYENEEGEAVINNTYLNESIGYNQSSISDIACNGTLTLTVFDKAGNFVVVNKSYNKHLNVDSSAPRITLSPESGYSQNVMVTITWPEGVSNRYYRLITPQAVGNKRTYTAPFGVTTEDWEGGLVAEGEVIVRAYYYKDGKETYVDKEITNVDTTPPPVSTVKESIRLTVDLTSDTPAVLSLRAVDAKSGIKKVYLKHFGTEFTLKDRNTYYLDVTNRLGSTVYVVLEDYASNRSEYTYTLTGFDKDRINFYSQKFKSIDPAEYDQFGYNELLIQYERLSNLLSSSSSLSSDILSYSQALDDAILGKYNVSFKLLSTIGGFAADFKFDVPVGATSILKGGRLYFEGSKIDLPQNKLDENVSVVGTISKYRNYDAYPFTLQVKDVNGTILNLQREIKVTLTLPGRDRIAKVYYEENGVITQLSSEINNGQITFITKGTGNFYLIVDKKVEEDKGPGLIIGGLFFPQNVLLIAGGIILGSLILVGVITPIIVKLIKNKKSGKNAFRYFR